MSILIDILLIAVFVIFVIVFSKYGFARTTYKIGKTWLSVFCSMVLGPWVAAKLEGWFLRNTITTGINGTLLNLVENNPNQYSLEQLFERMPEGFISFLNSCGINFDQLEAEYGSSSYATEEMISAISERIADPCISMISSIIGHVICFIVPLIFFQWLNFQIRKRRVAFFRYIDHFVGFLVGVAIGYCVSLATALIVQTIFQVIVCFDAHSSVTGIYDNSYVFKFLNEFNSLEFIRELFKSLVSKFSF